MVSLNCFTLDNVHPLATSDLYLPWTFPVSQKLIPLFERKKNTPAGGEGSPGPRGIRQGSDQKGW